mmetsp:Transcript_30812/g.66183  ORF Transcript_30812/g.66183 Transcript_30812/m.66183 type:complete len:95 (-) Transcript_30812:233-517(-)
MLVSPPLRAGETVASFRRALDAAVSMQPTVIVVEQVLGWFHGAKVTAGEAMQEAMLDTRTHFRWHRATLCPSTHCGAPHRRPRVWWVAIQRATF